MFVLEQAYGLIVSKKINVVIVVEEEANRMFVLSEEADEYLDTLILQPIR